MLLTLAVNLVFLGIHLEALHVTEFSTHMRQTLFCLYTKRF
ncbi:hypothetical protein O6H91_01G117600 [Diphasiastrum complanatum]|uniref:Uncharacterized protein n=1 Tax=Diphasiastrum complanatum TaxID=34168 RepID=A0ACC2EVB5_DIPCM|nr:hypothetical protein O6H91_01G117600 [Diphasiastrum complanatum]